MDNAVIEELDRVNAKSTLSDYEVDVTEDVFTWAYGEFGNQALNMSFSEMVQAYWDERLGE